MSIRPLTHGPHLWLALIPLLVSCTLTGRSEALPPPPPSSTDTGADTTASTTTTSEPTDTALTDSFMGDSAGWWDSGIGYSTTTDTGSTSVPGVLCSSPSAITTVSGGMSIRTGLQLTTLIAIDGLGEECGEEPPLLLSDLNADGVPEMGLICDRKAACDQLHILDGAALLASSPALLSIVHADTLYRHMATTLGDLDGDGLVEVGFGMANASLWSGGNLRWWSVVDGQSLLGAPVAHDVLGVGSHYGDAAPQPMGDVDADGSPDLMVWQRQTGTLHLLSGAQVIAGGVMAPQDAIRTIAGVTNDDDIQGVVPVGDVNSDGQIDVALALGLEPALYYGMYPAVVAITWGTDITDPTQSLRIESTHRGHEVNVNIEAVGDLDGDGLVELAVLLQTRNSSLDEAAVLSIIPGAVMALGQDIDPGLYSLGGVTYINATWNSMESCDLDGDGLPELILAAGVWNGSDLLYPGSLPVATGVARATCAGDLDGIVGSELLVGEPD